MRPLPLLLSACLLLSVAVHAGEELSCPAGTHAEGASPPAGLELRCVDAAGRAEGPWRTWYEGGQLMSERSMKEDREHGLQRSWWPNGQLMMEGASFNGTRVKGFRFWSITGQPSDLPQQPLPEPSTGATPRYQPK